MPLKAIDHIDEANLAHSDCNSIKGSHKIVEVDVTPMKDMKGIFFSPSSLKEIVNYDQDKQGE